MSMGMTFRLTRHTVRQCDIVEVWVDDKFIATITPNDTHDGVRVISKHMAAAFSVETDCVNVDFEVKPE